MRGTSSFASFVFVIFVTRRQKRYVYFCFIFDPFDMSAPSSVCILHISTPTTSHTHPFFQCAYWSTMPNPHCNAFPGGAGGWEKLAELYQNPLRLAIYKSNGGKRGDETGLSTTVGGLMGSRFGGGACDCDCHDYSDDEDICDDCDEAQCWSGGYWRTVPSEREVCTTILRDIKEVCCFVFDNLEVPVQGLR